MVEGMVCSFLGGSHGGERAVERYRRRRGPLWLSGPGLTERWSSVFPPIVNSLLLVPELALLLAHTTSLPPYEPGDYCEIFCAVQEWDKDIS